MKMCDIFGLKCAHEGCEDGLPLHISDYCLPREVIKQVYCGEHVPDDAKHEYFDTITYRYMIFEEWDSPKIVGVLEIDWKVFGEVVKKMVEDADFYGLSNLLDKGAPIDLNTSKDFMVHWG